MPTAPDGPHEDIQHDRRVSVRRKEDYFWLKSLADLTGEACIVVNRDMGIEFIDDKVFDLLDIPPSENIQTFNVLTRIMAEKGYFGHGDPTTFEALIGDLLTNQRLKQSKATQIINAVTPSGQHIDIRVSLGRNDSYLLLMRDTTQEELKRLALNTALEIGQSGYWFYNLETKQFDVRADSLEKHFSRDLFAKIQEDGFMDFVHPDDVAEAKAAMRRAVSTRKPTISHIRIISDDGVVHHLKSHVMPNIDESGWVRSLCCFFTTITQQVQTEQELRKAQEEAESALKAKNEFLGRLSHEVRTPLNAVIGMADALVHNCKDQEILPQLKLIQNSAENVMEMVDSTLEHTKLADDAVELNSRLCSPRDVVKSITRKWQNRASMNNTTLTCHVHQNVPEEFVFDDYRYEQCLSNLISNALKFARGGKVDVMLAPSGQGKKRQLLLAVRDDGIGMESDALSQVFKPFKQANKSISRKFGGTGLGLAIVKDLVDLMGGRISVTSEIGKGTVFAITLPMPEDVEGSIAKPAVKAPVKPAPPVLERPAPQRVVLETPAPPQPGQEGQTVQREATSQSLVNSLIDEESARNKPFGSLRVLIVDDNATNHIVVESLLRREVGTTDTALNGQEALEKLKEKPFDLVLMDIHMPVMDGIETTLAIRSEPSDYQTVPIIALTADPQYQQARLCRNIGMDGSLGKPIKLNDLLQAFEDVLNDRGNNKVFNAA